jgi:TonB family protein
VARNFIFGSLISTIGFLAAMAAAQAPDQLAMPRIDPSHPPKMGAKYYPKESLRLHEEGRCIVRVQVDADGGVYAMQLLASTGYTRLDDACIAAWMNGHLFPATLGGKPVVRWAVLPMVWALEKRAETMPGQRKDLASIPKVEEESQIKVGSAYYPEESRRRHEEGECVVHVFVEPEGALGEIAVTKSTGFAELDQACLSAVRDTQFVPAKENGVAVGAWVDIVMSWRLAGT